MGLISAEAVGGRGLGMRTAAMVVERLAKECASTAMVVCMHYSATAVLEQHGPVDVRKEIAAGRHLTTLAFSEIGSRGQFWAPVSTATRAGAQVKLDARKSFATSAHAAHSYVWSSKPLAGAEASTLWLVPRTTPGVRAGDGFDGLGLRGNDSSPITAESATVDAGVMLGADGAGFGIMMGVVLPDPVTRAVATLAAQDEARHVAFGLAHLARHVGEDPSLRPRLAAAIERRHAALAHTTGLNAEVLDALHLLAAGDWAPASLRRAHGDVLALVNAMDASRQAHLRRLGFPPSDAMVLSSLHTRNFM